MNMYASHDRGLSERHNPAVIVAVVIAVMTAAVMVMMVMSMSLAKILYISVIAS